MTYSIEDQDKWMRKTLLSLLPLHPKTPREAYRLLKKGDAPSDAEWAEYGGAWERNWDECVELYQTVMGVEKMLTGAYQDYVRRTG